MIDHEGMLLVDRYANDLRSRIERGDFGTSGVIPSMSELGLEWGVKSRALVAEVIMLLRAQGYLVQMPKKRYRVVYPRIVLPGLTPNFKEYIEAMGFNADETDIEPAKVETMPLDIARIFTRIDTGEPAIREGVHVVHRLRRQGIADLPMRLGHIWYPMEIAEPYLDKMRNDCHFDLPAALKVNQNIALEETDFTLRCRIPDHFEMRELNLARYQPILECLRIGYTANREQVITLHRTILDGTRFEYRLQLPAEFWK